MSDQYGSSGPSAPGPGDPAARGWSQPSAPAASSGYGQPDIPGYGYPAPAPPMGYPDSYPGSQPSYGQPARYPMVPAGLPLRNDYALWGRRVAAGLVDHAPSLVGSIVFIIGYIYWLVGVVRSGATPDFTSGLVPMIVGGALMLIGFGWSIYDRWVLAGRTGQSVGKRVTKIMLISEETGLPIGGVNAFLRDLVHILDGFAYVGYLWPLWDERRQTFADKILRTVVVTVPQRPPA